mgnify:CR=1 FL=1
MARHNHNPTLVNDFAYATECNLATLGELLGIKSSSKSRINRQRGICLTMLQALFKYRPEIDWGGSYHPNYSRVQEILAATTPLEVEQALDAHIEKITKIYR